MTSEEKKDQENDISTDLSKGISNFIIKTVVVVAAITISLSLLTPEMPKVPETERNKLILLGFVQNPYVLWRLSAIEEEKGKLKNSITYIEAAIGLMEMNGASEKGIRKYKERLEELNSK